MVQRGEDPAVIVWRGLDDVRAHAGKHLGTSEWTLVTQKDITAFGEATGDLHWIHLDAERAERGPFGKTIHMGYGTVSAIIPHIAQIYRYENIPLVLNYGIEHLRLPAPVPVESHIRLDVTVKEVTEIAHGGLQVTFASVMECDEAERPALVADLLWRYYPVAVLSGATRAVG
jgi:acyl dehydratase